MATAGLTPGELDGLEPWLQPYAQFALDYFQYLTGGTFDVNGRLRGGVRPVVTSVRRSRQRQSDLYANRASNPYPVNRPGDSAHEYGMGFDSSFGPAEKPRYMPHWVALRRELGWRVPENDDVHSEVPNWRDAVFPR